MRRSWLELLFALQEKHVHLLHDNTRIAVHDPVPGIYGQVFGPRGGGLSVDMAEELCRMKHYILPSAVLKGAGEFDETINGIRRLGAA